MILISIISPALSILKTLTFEQFLTLKITSEVMWHLMDSKSDGDFVLKSHYFSLSCIRITRKESATYFDAKYVLLNKQF